MSLQFLVKFLGLCLLVVSEERRKHKKKIMLMQICMPSVNSMSSQRPLPINKVANHDKDLDDHHNGEDGGG